MTIGEIADFIAMATNRIDWSAWEAIGTVGALWFAVSAAGRDARLKRLRAHGFLQQLSWMLFRVYHKMPHFLAGDPVDDALLHYFDNAKKRAGEASAMIREFGLPYFVEVDLADEFVSVPVVLSSFEPIMNRVAAKDGAPPTLEEIDISQLEQLRKGLLEAEESIRKRKRRLNPWASFTATARSFGKR